MRESHDRTFRINIEVKSERLKLNIGLKKQTSGNVVGLQHDRELMKLNSRANIVKIKLYLERHQMLEKNIKIKT